MFLLLATLIIFLGKGHDHPASGIVIIGRRIQPNVTYCKTKGRYVTPLTQARVTFLRVLGLRYQSNRTETAAPDLSVHPTPLTRPSQSPTSSSLPRLALITSPAERDGSWELSTKTAHAHGEVSSYAYCTLALAITAPPLLWKSSNDYHGHER